MASKHPDLLNAIDDKIEMKIRNVKIQTYWHTMGRWTKLSYRQKIQFLMDEFHLSHSRIEDIIEGKD